MKRVSTYFVLMAIILSVLVSPIQAASSHTYYNQYKAGLEDSVNKRLCYLTAFAMIATDLGHPATPAEVYLENGGGYYKLVNKNKILVPKDADFYTLARKYQLTYKYYAVSQKDASEREQTIIDELNSGKYPAGIMVCTVVNHQRHMVVARKVENGRVLFDCPANGCCIPLEKTGHEPTWGNVTSYGTLTPKQNSPAGNESGGQGSTSLTVLESTTGAWYITVPTNYKLLCYSSSTATSSNGKYVRPQSSAYRITCTQKAVLSNGSIRYYGTFDTNNHYWFVYTSEMTVESKDIKPQTYTVTFDPNGGTVNQKTKTVTAGNEIGTLPTPTRDGYTFLYWSTEKNSSGMVVNENNLIVDQNRTLYACWKENPKEEKFTVTFDYNGGAMRRESKNVLKGDTVGTLPTLAREGYTLLGWSTNRDGIGMIMRKGNELVVNEDITLYAIWKKDPSTPSGNSHTVRTEQLDLRSMKTTSNDAEGWSWNKETKTLILNNVTIETKDLYALRADSATIVLEGNSTIKSTYYDVKSGSASTGAKTTAGIYTFSGTLTFEGTGSLTVIGGTSKGGSYGISAYDGQVIVNSGNLTAIGGESTVFATSGIRANRLTVNDGTVVASGGRGNGKLDGGSYGAIVHNNLNVNGGTLQLSSGTVGAGALSGSLAGLHGNSSCKINLSSNMAVSDPSGTAVGLYRKNSTIDIREFITILNSQGEPVKDVIIQQKGTSTTPDPKAQPENVWTDWSSWSATPIFASDTRQVETREIKVSDSYTEYRYGGYVTYDGKHDCWCETYLRNKYGSASLRYSDWSTTRFRPNGKGWTCGSCGGNHIGIDHYGSDGKAWWAEYVLPDDSYYWEESRTVDAGYETQYRYRDWVSG